MAFYRYLRRRRIVRPLTVAALMSCAFASPGRAATGADVADAAQAGDRARVRALLARHADANAPQADGTTALHWAAHHNDPRDHR